MYDNIPFDAENHLMCLWDAGLNTRTDLAARSQALLRKE